MDLILEQIELKDNTLNDNTFDIFYDVNTKFIHAFENDVPAATRCSFSCLAGHEHDLGPSKLSSSCCAVCFLKNELSLQRGALFYTHL